MVNSAKKFIAGAFFAVFPFVAFVAAFGGEGPGTTGANFLKIPVGPRQIAMGDQGSAVIGDVFGLNYNPAVIPLAEYQEIAFMYNQWVEGIHQQYLGYVYPKLGPGGVAASLNLFSVSPFQGYDNSGAAAGDVSAQDFMFTLGYGRHLWGDPDPDEGRSLYGGAALKFIRERLESDSASTVAGDLGLLYRFPYKGVDWRAGFALQNLGPGLTYYENTGALPRTWSLGLSGLTRYFYGDPFTFSLELQKAVDRGVSVSLGGEYWISKIFALRLGYKSSDDLGPGIRSGIGFKFKPVQLDYAFSMMGSFGLTHRASITYRFGAPIERTPVMSPEEKKARKHVLRAWSLTEEKRYLEAVLELNAALELNPRSQEALYQLKKVREMMDAKVQEHVLNAKALHDQKKYLEAVLELDRALELKPESQEALELLRQVKEAMKQGEGGRP